MPADIPKLLQEYERLKAESDAGFRPICDQIDKYVMPRVGGTPSQHATKDTASATWKDPDVWDFTAPVALSKLAAHIHTSVVPAGLRWGTFAWEDEELAKDEDCAKALEKRTDVVFRELAESDFDAEMASAFQEYCGPGNMVVVQEVIEKARRYEGLDFTAIPIAEVEFTEDRRGRMNKLFRRLRWTYAQAAEQGGKRTPRWIADKAEGPQTRNELVDVIFAIFERPEVLARPIGSKVAAPKNRPYGFAYFTLKGDQLGEEGGYYDFPAHIARFYRTPGSRWAHGLGNIALPHVKGLNAFVEQVYLALALAVDPPKKVTERGLLSKLNNTPGGKTVVESPDDVKPLLDGVKADIRVGEFSLAEQRQAVRELFHEDQLTLKDSPSMTATEAQIRYDIMLKLLGPVIARLISEFVTPVLTGTYRALLRAGKFDAIPLPPKARKADAEMRIVYRGAFARSRRTDDVAAIERALSSAAGALKMGFEEVLDEVKPGQAIRKIFELLDVGPGVLATPEEAKKNREARLARQERLMQAQAAKLEGDAAEKRARAAQAVAGGGGGALPAAAAGAFPVAPQPALTPGGQVIA